jgi:hypothetical protein
MPPRLWTGALKGHRHMEVGNVSILFPAIGRTTRPFR